MKAQGLPIKTVILIILGIFSLVVIISAFISFNSKAKSSSEVYTNMSENKTFSICELTWKIGGCPEGQCCVNGKCDYCPSNSYCYRGKCVSSCPEGHSIINGICLCCNENKENCIPACEEGKICNKDYVKCQDKT